MYFDCHIYLAIAFCHSELENFKKAEEAAKSAIASEPEFVGGHRVLSLI